MGRCEFEICLNPAFVSEPLVTVLGAVRNHGYSIVFTLQQLLALSLMSAFSWSQLEAGSRCCSRTDSGVVHIAVLYPYYIIIVIGSGVLNYWLLNFFWFCADI